MAQAWPGSLPDCPLPDWDRSGPTRNLLRTQMDVGPAKVRRRGSVGVVRYTFRFHLTRAQLLTFRAWYQSTVGLGSEPFEFTDPVTRELSVFRFADEGYSVERPSALRYIVSMVWELMPS